MGFRRINGPYLGEPIALINGAPREGGDIVAPEPSGVRLGLRHQRQQRLIRGIVVGVRAADFGEARLDHTSLGGASCHGDGGQVKAHFSILFHPHHALVARGQFNGVRVTGIHAVRVDVSAHPQPILPRQLLHLDAPLPARSGDVRYLDIVGQIHEQSGLLHSLNVHRGKASNGKAFRQPHESALDGVVEFLPHGDLLRGINREIELEFVVALRPIGLLSHETIQAFCRNVTLELRIHA